MTRECAKKWEKEIQAYADGKTIQAFFNKEWKDNEEPAFLDCYEYRIKPEPKLIPYDFSDAEKLIGKVVKNKNDTYKCIIISVSKDCVYMNNNTYSFRELLENNTYLDGSPCGKVVDE